MHKVNIRGHKIKNQPKGMDALIRNAKVQSYPAMNHSIMYLCIFRDVLELLCSRAGCSAERMDIIQTTSGLKWRVIVSNGIKLY